jgi:membrane associated rhomboid family serine protease
MGIYDREYYRKEGPSFLGSFSERGKICKWLIGLNILFFVIQIAAPKPEEQLIERRDGRIARIQPPDAFTAAFQLDVDKVLHQGQVWRVLTYSFLHQYEPHQLPWHIIWNMLFLWWFGTDVEDTYGPREFLAIYLMAAFLGGIAFVLTWVSGLTGAACIGASGAVMAVMVLCALHYPKRIILLFFILPVPIWAFVLWEVFQDAWHFLTGTPGGTAVTVHLAGAAFAFCYFQRHWRLITFWDSVRSWYRQRSRPRLRVYREDAPVGAPLSSLSGTADDDQLEAKLDQVLEKVAQYGQASLSESERAILMRASEVYKRRRT